VVEWLDSSIFETAELPVTDEAIPSAVDRLKDSLDSAARQSSISSAKIGRKVSHRPSQQQARPQTYSALLIKSYELQRDMKAEALTETPKAYTWKGDWLQRGSEPADYRCQPGRLGANSQFILQPIPLPKPGVTRYPFPTSKELYQRKKALQHEWINLQLYNQSMRKLFEKLDNLKGNFKHDFSQDKMVVVSGPHNVCAPVGLAKENL
ncbi:unnamed protein product, partial [Echinostoma caproni]|uniref:HYLS1_C domain-containing protein n=1 Tax=Echinostoma caproni TaxID=27848 RepID=A0A183A4U5_9TREM